MTSPARGAGEPRTALRRSDQRRARRRARRRVASAAALVAVSAVLAVWSAAGGAREVPAASGGRAVVERSTDLVAAVRPVSGDDPSAGAVVGTGQSPTTAPSAAAATGRGTAPTARRSPHEAERQPRASSRVPGVVTGTGPQRPAPGTSSSVSSAPASTPGTGTSQPAASAPAVVPERRPAPAATASASQRAAQAASQAAAQAAAQAASQSSALAAGASAPTQTTSAAAAVTGGPLSGASFWVDPDNEAALELARGGDRALGRIAAAPSAVWLGDWVPTGQVQARTASVLERAGAAVPVLVLYAVPGRDCGSYSAGGLGSPEAYAAWIRAVAAGIGDRRAVVVLEPDALAQVDCLSGTARAQRLALLRDAVDVLAPTGAVTYLDAGNSGWVDAATMAQRLRDAGVARARGFALNTSNFQRTSDEEAYGERLSAALGGSHYVVDTSRNGNGPATGDLSWCNPRGRALGEAPTTATRAAHADAYLWVKRVGESDGGCGRGEPSAGTWWPQYAVGLARGSS